MRKVLYITGTRADYGLMQETLSTIDKDEDLSLSIAVTGMHLLEQYGLTVNEIRNDGYHIAGEVLVAASGGEGQEMAFSLADQVKGFTQILLDAQPDIVLVLGDRGEMLAAAIAALHLNTVVAHIHGGELSGTVDESIRHAITKLSHYHFATSDDARERIIRLGEEPDNVFTTGAPGLDAVFKFDIPSREAVLDGYSIDPGQKVALVLFHPVVQQAAQAEAQTKALLEALDESGISAVILNPNSDAGGAGITTTYDEYKDNPKFVFCVHLQRADFLSLMATADIMVGNSSSGIIEAACFGTPVVNIGSRQNRRLRNNNIVDVDVTAKEISSAISACLQKGKFPKQNKYGDGTANIKITHALKEISLSPDVLEKVNAY